MTNEYCIYENRILTNEYCTHLSKILKGDKLYVIIPNYTYTVQYHGVRNVQVYSVQ